jgi:hypothetical protein
MERLLFFARRPGGDQDASSMIRGSIERASPNGSRLTSFLEPDAKAYARARRLMANWMAAKVMKAASVSARFS